MAVVRPKILASLGNLLGLKRDYQSRIRMVWCTLRSLFGSSSTENFDLEFRQLENKT